MAKSRSRKVTGRAKQQQQRWLGWVPNFPATQQTTRGLAVALVFAATGLSLLVLISAATNPGYKAGGERAHTRLVNDYRVSNGASNLQHIDCLHTAAQRWSKNMARQNRLYHSRVGTRVSKFCGSGWRVVGENVGRGGDFKQVFNAFKASHLHNINMLDRRFDKIGVGIYNDGRTAWVTQLFVDCGNCSGVWRQEANLGYDQFSGFGALDWTLN